MRLLLLVCLLCLTGCASTMSAMMGMPDPSQKGVVTEYDEFKDLTTHTAGARMNSLSATRPFFMDGYLVLSCAGNQPCTESPAYGMLIRSWSEDWRFLNSHDVAFIADGERFGPYETAHDGKVMKDADTIESLTFLIPEDAASAISSAQSVRFQVGTFEGELPHDRRGSWRELVSQ